MRRLIAIVLLLGIVPLGIALAQMPGVGVPAASNGGGSGGSSGPGASSSPQFAALGVGTAAPTATGQADIGFTLSVGQVPAPQNTGDLELAGGMATGGNALLPTLGDVLVARASGGTGVIAIGGTGASADTDIVGSSNTMQLQIGSGTQLQVDTAGAHTINNLLVGGVAAGGNTGGVANECSGEITLAAGIGNSVVSAQTNTSNGSGLAGSCIKNYTKIVCVNIGSGGVGVAPATPANTPYMISCFASPTVTATAGMAVTATVTAIFAIASTSNATPVIEWWGQHN